VYCYQIDTGTCLHPDALIRFTEYLESNPGIGAIAPRVLPSVPRRTDSFFTTWQFTDLAFRNGITWPAEVMSGFLSVIPGQTGALRWAAMKTPSGDCDVTTAYLRGVLEGGALTKTMYLAEDRVIGILLCLTHERWQLGFVPPAAVTTDSCDTLRELLQQRRRWINSALACRFWLLRYWTRDVCRRRETKGRWGFSFALLFQILIGLRDFFAPAQLVALIATMMAGVSALFGSRAGVAQFVISLMIVLEAGFLAFDARRLRQGLAPAFAIARQCWGWCTAAALLALILSLREPLFALVMLAPCAVLVPLFVLAPRKSFALLVRTQFCPLPNLMVVLFTQSYAYWRLHDISWGTKGLRKAWNDGDTARGLRILRRTVISLWVSSNGLLIVCALTAEGIFHRALNPVIEMACIVDFIFALMATAFLVLRRYAGQAGGRVRGAFADSANCGWHAE
jgi:cellulose synthase/poly-beta-1,6-N-acetylglucosamine synthase-like glycosyltransferase